MNSDYPNRISEHFTSFPNNNKMTVDTNPKVFEHIHRHLQGYDIDLTSLDECLLKDVHKDAIYFRLEKLITKLNLTSNRRRHRYFSDGDTTMTTDSDTAMSAISDTTVSVITVSDTSHIESIES
jgi:hypothetical protein